MKANNPDSPQAHESPVDGDDFKHQVQPKQEWDANHNGIPDYLERPADKPVHDWLKMPWSNQDESSLSDKPAHNWFRMPWSHQEPSAPEPEPHLLIRPGRTIRHADIMNIRPRKPLRKTQASGRTGPISFWAKKIRSIFII